MHEMCTHDCMHVVCLCTHTVKHRVFLDAYMHIYIYICILLTVKENPVSMLSQRTTTVSYPYLTWLEPNSALSSSAELSTCEK